MVSKPTSSAKATTPSRRLALAKEWFGSMGWKPFDFQVESWKAYLGNSDGLIHSATGTGKTLAAWIGPLLQFLDTPIDHKNWTKTRGKPDAPPLLALWITPLKALAADTEQSLRIAIEGLKVPWTLERRTGDSASSQKQRQKHKLPSALIITPESLTLLLSYPDARELFKHLRCIIVDEWHELLGTKRGVQNGTCFEQVTNHCT